MKYPKIKICDVRSPQIAKFCLENHVDFIGLHQIYSPITAEKIELFRSIKKNAGKMSTVLVTKIEDIDELTRIICAVSFDYIQLHFDASLDYIRDLKQNIRKKTNKDIGIISVFQADKCDFLKVQKISNIADYILFDSFIEGGTGIVISDEAMESIVKYCGNLNYFIAGGLTPINVHSIISKMHPFALDVQTGVELKKHVKDIRKIRAFVEAVHTSMNQQ